MNIKNLKDFTHWSFNKQRLWIWDNNPARKQSMTIYDNNDLACHPITTRRCKGKLNQRLDFTSVFSMARCIKINQWDCRHAVLTNTIQD